ncbi:MAG: acetyl-CoA carboxylase biotin carboxyl carrier protein [Cyanobacteria bacterium SIG29]|nr:acetyl-CoA carboxylase biotin carboxyl carrier protein [Cyanobacteria bacterium SIG29]
MKFDLDYLDKLAKIVYENDLSEITLEDEERAVCFKREKQVVPMPAAVTPVVMPSTVTSQVIIPEKVEAKVEAPVEHSGKPITAPMVGTFYAAPSPDDAPFVKVGDTIATGQVVCIVEAMKLMNEIESEVSGKITEICVQNGESVEFGQVLMYVE